MVQAKPENPVTLTIDAGGTSVRFRLAQGSDRLLDDWSLPPRDNGHPPALRSEIPTPGYIVAGITKFSRLGVLESWHHELSTSYPSAKRIIVPDYELAAAAAITAPHSVMLLAGTGSLACTFDGPMLVRIGGRGWEYGDEGSGAFLTTEVIRRCIRVMDGMLPPSEFLLNVIASSRTSDAGDFAVWARAESDQTGRGFLVPFISRAADKQDIDAINLLNGAGGWLARLAHSVNQRLQMPRDVINIQAVGGLWDASNHIEVSTVKTLGKWYSSVTFKRFSGSHLDGGLRIINSRFLAKE